MFDPHNNIKLYEAHIPEALLAYNDSNKQFSKHHLVDSTSMVMSPVDILNPDFEVSSSGADSKGSFFFAEIFNFSREFCKKVGK